MKDALLWPQFDRRTDRKVLAILHSGRVNYWTGEEGRRFEEAFAAWCGVRQAVSVSSGTAALHLALEALGIGAGDDVIVTPYSFRSSATCVHNAGAHPIFAHVGDDHLLNAETIAAALTPKTRAIVVVHLFGQVADMGPIMRLARQRGLFVIEDCAQCLGGEYRGRKVGTIGDVGCFSFCQSKHITAGGEGGMVVCKTRKVTNAVRSLRDVGWKVGSCPRTYDRIGYNARLTEIQSVIAHGELDRLDSWNLPRRRLLAERLIAGLSGHPLICQMPVDTIERHASFWLVPFVLDARQLKVRVSRFIEEMQRRGAGAYKVMWPPMADFPQLEKLMPNTLGFWVHPTRTIRDIDSDVRIFRSTFEALAKH